MKSTKLQVDGPTCTECKALGSGVLGWGGGLGDHGESYRVAGFSVFRNVGGDGVLGYCWMDVLQEVVVGISGLYLGVSPCAEGAAETLWRAQMRVRRSAVSDQRALDIYRLHLYIVHVCLFSCIYISCTSI